MKNVLWIATALMGITGVFLGCHTTTAADAASDQATQSSPATSSDGATTDQLAQLLKEGKVKEYARCVAQDQSLGIEAARTIVPAGWTCQGEVAWPLQSATTPGIYQISAVSPDQKASIQYVSAMSYQEPLGVQMRGFAMSRAQLYHEGQYSDSGSPMLRLMSPADYSVYFLKKLKPGVQDVRVLSVTPPSASDKAEMDKQAAQLSAQLTQAMGASVNQGWYIRAGSMDFAVVELSAVLDGKPYKLIMIPKILSWVHGVRNPRILEETVNWTVPGILIYACEPDAFDANAAAVQLFVANFVGNGKWQDAMSQVSQEISQRIGEKNRQQWQAAIQQVQQRGEANRRMNQQARDSQRDYSSSIANRANVNSKVMAGWGDVIAGKDKYRMPDGGVGKVDMHYDHVYVGKTSGNIYATQGVTLDPNRYTRLQKIPDSY